MRRRAKGNDTFKYLINCQTVENFPLWLRNKWNLYSYALVARNCCVSLFFLSAFMLFNMCVWAVCFSCKFENNWCSYMLNSLWIILCIRLFLLGFCCCCLSSIWVRGGFVIVFEFPSSPLVRVYRLCALSSHAFSLYRYCRLMLYGKAIICWSFLKIVTFFAIVCARPLFTLIPTKNVLILKRIFIFAIAGFCLCWFCFHTSLSFSFFVVFAFDCISVPCQTFKWRTFWFNVCIKSTLNYSLLH